MTHKSEKTPRQAAKGAASVSGPRILLAAASLMGLSIGAAVADQSVPASAAHAASIDQAKGKVPVSDQSKLASNQIKANSNQIKVTSNQAKLNSNQVKANSSQIKVTSNQAKLTSNQIKANSNQIKATSNQIKATGTPR